MQFKLLAVVAGQGLSGPQKYSPGFYTSRSQCLVSINYWATGIPKESLSHIITPRTCTSCVAVFYCFEVSPPTYIPHMLLLIMYPRSTRPISRMPTSVNARNQKQTTLAMSQGES